VSASDVMALWVLWAFLILPLFVGRWLFQSTGTGRWTEGERERWYEDNERKKRERRIRDERRKGNERGIF